MNLYRRVKPTNLFGNCYSMTIQPEIARLGITEIVVNSLMDAYVYLHYPEQFTYFDSQAKLSIVLGEKLFINMAYEIDEDSLGQGSSLPCEKNLDFEYDACLYKGANRHFLSIFGCTVPYLPGKDQTCNLNEHNATKIYDQYDYIISNGQTNICQKPCRSMRIITGNFFKLTMVYYKTMSNDICCRYSFKDFLFSINMALAL